MSDNMFGGVCPSSGCQTLLLAQQVVCDRHWDRVNSKTKLRYFEALMSVLDEAATVKDRPLVSI